MPPPVKSDFDVIVAGAGLAGSACATVLARAGWHVALLERDTFPRDKLCGEFLSGESAGFLEKLGCLPQILDLNPPEVRHVRFITARGKTLTIPLPHTAFGVTRRRLDHILFQNACAAGATGVTQCDVRQLEPATGLSSPHVQATVPDDGPVNMGANAIIAAYGRRAAPDKALERDHPLKNGTIGLKLHHVPADGPAGQQAYEQLEGITEIFALPGGYCGISLVDGGLVNVCMLLEKSTLSRARSPRWPDVATMIAAANPALGSRLATLTPVHEPVQSVAQISFAVKGTHLPGIYFTGDAAGMIAPLCGDGQAMALESGLMLAHLLLDNGPPGNLKRNGRMIELAWQRQWEQRFVNRMRIGRSLQKLILQPTTAELAVACLAPAPRVVKQWLSKATRS